MLKVAAFTGGQSVPSARFRVRQYISPLSRSGIEVNEYAAPLRSFPPRQKALRPVWAAATLAARLPGIVRSFACDVTLLQREMLSTFATLECLTRAPRILDVDDAIYLRRGGGFARRLAEGSDVVICGNAFLAEQFAKWNRNVEIVATAVDADRFLPADPQSEPVIGWSGSSAGLKYVYAIEPALIEVLRNVPGSRLRIVSEAPPRFRHLPPGAVEYVPWSAEGEVAALQGMAVGIMPLDDSLWERGKCSYKMLTYMSCGIPVVVSPIGMNREVLEQGNVGVGAATLGDWSAALITLCREAAQRRAMGSAGRQVILERYALGVLAPRIATIIKSVAGRRPS